MEDYKDYYKNWNHDELVEEVHQIGNDIGYWSKLAVNNYEKQCALREENRRLTDDNIELNLEITKLRAELAWALRAPDLT